MNNTYLYLLLIDFKDYEIFENLNLRHKLTIIER